MRAILGALVLVLAAPAAPALAGTGLGSHPTTAAAAPTAVVRAPAPAPRAVPALKVRTQVRDLANPWDVQPIGDGRILITERDSGRLLTWRNGNRRAVRFPTAKIWRSGETGLMSLEIDPKFEKNRRFYTCSGWQKKGGGHDVRVNAWKLNQRATRARLVEKLVGGFPTSSGRHGGCRLLITSNGALLVGTGDAAQGTNPRDLTSLGGKTLRLNRLTGRPWPGNAFADSENKRTRYVHTFGHRNVQGLAQRADGTLWSAEHGPDRDDEVNLLRDGRDYGWHPVPGYDESVPMTDHDLDGRQVNARWRSGSPTLATSGLAWVKGKRWGSLNGTLAVAALKAGRVVFMKFDSDGKLRWTRAPQALQQYGRLRSITSAPGGDLLVTTSNGSGDSVLRVSPR